MGSSTTASCSVRKSRSTTTKRRDLAELIVAYLLILTVIWTPRPWQVRIYAIAALFIVATTYIGFCGFHAMGFRSTNFLRSSWVIGASLALTGIAAVISRHLHALHAPPGIAPFFDRYAGYIVFSFVQQWLLQAYFLARLFRLLHSPRSAALCAAGLFALAHLPSPILTVATIIWGTISCLLFLQYRNLFSISVAHAILGITLAMCIPGHITHNMRVGLGYLMYSPQSWHHLSH